MYLNRKRLMFWLLLWSVIVIPAFTLDTAFIGTMFSTQEWELFPVFLFFFLVFSLLCWGYISTFIKIGHLIKLESILKNDADGIVPADEIEEYMNITPQKLMKIRHYGDRKKILINLVYDETNQRFILTDRADPNAGAKDRPFIGLSCPGCAAPLKIRSGTTGSCPFCGRDVTAPNIVVGEPKS